MQSCSSHSLVIKARFGQVDLLLLKDLSDYQKTTERLALDFSHLMGFKRDTSSTKALNSKRSI